MSSRPVSVLDIHGTADPCWAYAGGSAACAQMDGLDKIGVTPTIAGWVTRNGCPASPVGPVTSDFDADELMWSFFEAHPIP